MVDKLRYVTEIFYKSLCSLDERISLFESSIELDKESSETVRSMLSRLKSTEKNNDNLYGILDEIVDRSLLKELPWSDMKYKSDLLKNGFQERFPIYQSSLKVIVDPNKSLSRVHEVNLDSSYQVLLSSRVLDELNKVNKDSKIPFGFEFAIYSNPQKLLNCFDRISGAILTRR